MHGCPQITGTAAGHSMTTATRPAADSQETAKFRAKRERILDAATLLINQKGVKGMTFVEVAERVGLTTTSVTYYFKRKELLAEAALERSLMRIDRLVDQAAAEATPRARVRTYLRLYFEMRARIRQEAEPPITLLSDMRAMDEAVRTKLYQRYRSLVQRVGAFFEPDETDSSKARSIARAHVLTENMHWAPAWLSRYEVDDFDRARDWLFDLFDKGLAPAGAKWAPGMLEPSTRADEACETSDARASEQFLRAATKLINERGYRGASVDRIASELNVTKGSFYHHLEAKDDLVLQCFARSYDHVSAVQHAAFGLEASHWQKLSSAVAALVEDQLFGDFPLLRVIALQALPREMRIGVFERSNRLAFRFSGMIVDGIADGSVRAVDPYIASQVVMSTINAAYDLKNWAATLPRETAVEYYAQTIAFGLFD